MSLRVWLPLNGDLHNQGLSNVTATNHGATVSISGKIGSCYIFDGTDDYLSLNNLNLGNKESFSICFWVYAGSNGLTNLIQIKSDSSVAFQIYEDGKFSFRDSKHGNLTDITFEAPTENIWTHYSIIYDNGDWRIYKNGIICRNFEASQLATFYPGASTFYIGVRKITAGNYYFAGKLNDVRIYDHALSELEIKEIARAKVLHYPLCDKNVEMTTNLCNGLKAGGRTTLSSNPVKITTTGENADTYWYIKTSTALVSGTVYTVSLNCTGLSSGEYWKFGVGAQSGANNCGYFSIYQGYNTFTFTLPSGLDGATQLIFDDMGGSSGIRTKITNFFNVQLEAKDHATAFINYGTSRTSAIIYDISGYCNNGIIIGDLEVSTNTPKYNVSTYISSGNTNYITTPTLQLPGDQITMNFWFKSSNKDPGSNYHMPFEGTANSNQAYEMSIYKTGYLRGGLTIAGTRKVDNCTSTKLTDGNWHMCTMTYDGATIKRYVDATMEKSTSATGALATSSAFVIGHYGSNTSYYCKEAYISDVRLYTTALSAQDILSLYHNSALVDEQGIIHGAIH